MFSRARRAWAIFRCGPCNAARLSCSWPLQVWKQKPIVTPAWLGPPPAPVGLGRIVGFLSLSTKGTAPGRWTQQPRNLSLERDSGDVHGVELLQPSKAGRFLVETASQPAQEHSNSRAGSGGGARPARSLCRLGRRLTAQVGRPHDEAALQRREITQRRGKHKPMVLLSMEMVRS